MKSDYTCLNSKTFDIEEREDMCIEIMTSKQEEGEC